MSSPLCQLVALSDVWVNHVLIQLNLKEIVRLDTAFLNRSGRTALRESYWAHPPIQLPFSLCPAPLERSLRWLIQRGISVSNLALQLQYLQSDSLRSLLAGNVQIITGGLRIVGANDSNIITVSSLLSPSLVDAVDDFSISSARAPMSEIVTSNVRLPFRHLKRFGWHRPTVDGQCLLSVLEDNCFLEELHVDMRHLPDGFMSALAIRGNTLTTLHVQAMGLTDADLQELGLHCKVLVDLSLSALGERLRNVTDAGIAAVAEGCAKLQRVSLIGYVLSGTALTALFAHCLQLNRIQCPDVSLNDAAVLALCDLARVASIQDLSCSWAASSLLHEDQYRHAFAGLRSYQVFDIAAHALDSLCAALQVMHQLQHFCLYSLGFERTFVPAAVLHAVAGGTTALRRLCTTSFVELVGNGEGGLLTIARRNPNLTYVSLEDKSWVVTDMFVHALAQHCVNLQRLNVVSATDVTDAAVVDLALSCRSLDELDLRSCAGLTNRSILALADNCPSLTLLDVRGSTSITQPALEQLLRSCTQLYRLRVATASLSASAAVRLKGTMKSAGAHITRTQAPV